MSTAENFDKPDRLDDKAASGKSRVGQALAWTVVLIVMLAEIALCCWVMSLNPIWNGEIPDHRGQYEQIARSFAEGRLDFGYDVDEGLETLDNPYSPAEREEAGVQVHWDHSYYNGKYYMYFGVAPVIELFLPYYLITEEDLTTYHATQIYVALIILGFYLLFFLLQWRGFPNLPKWLVLLCCIAASAGSVWFACARPAMYCTAISAGICHMLWSLILFIIAFCFARKTRSIVILTILGSLFGAVTFACRPTIGIVNMIAVLPFAISFLASKTMDAKKRTALLIAGILPYIAVATALMLYNYARFETVFEFGQAYQLTVADQSGYGSNIGAMLSVDLIKALFKAFFSFNGFSQTFPFVSFGGIFANFPILLSAFAVLLPPTYKSLSSAGRSLGILAIGLLISAVGIVFLTLLWSPKYLERYNMDVYWMLFIAVFFALGAWSRYWKPEKHLVLTGIIGLVLVLTTVSAILFFFVPDDKGILTQVPESVEFVESLGFEVESVALS